MNADVAKIIGWVDPSRFIAADGQPGMRWVEPSYTADEVAAWLLTKRATMKIQHGTSGIWNLLLWDTEHDWWADACEGVGPTILAALEAAVLAVHEQETTDE